MASLRINFDQWVFVTLSLSKAILICLQLFSYTCISLVLLLIYNVLMVNHDIPLQLNKQKTQFVWYIYMTVCNLFISKTTFTWYLCSWMKCNHYLIFLYNMLIVNLHLCGTSLQLDEMLCKLKMWLKDALSSVLETEMKAAYDDIW